MIKVIKVVIPPGKVCLFSADSDPKKAKLIEAGVFKFYKFPWQKCFWYLVDVTEQNVASSVLVAFSKENLDFRYTYQFVFKILDPKTLLARFGIGDVVDGDVISEKVKNYLITFLNEATKVPFHEVFAKEIMKKKAEISSLIFANLKEKIKTENLQMEVLDFNITSTFFPPVIQKLISSEVENEIISKMELESAKSKVAVAKTLKADPELMRSDETMLELKKLEVIEKLSTNSGAKIVVNLNSKSKNLDI